MSVVEKVDAEIRLEFGTFKKNDYGISRTLPNEFTTVKALEDYLFNLRCRGASDDSRVKFEHKKFWDGSHHKDRLTAFVVKSSATMDGFGLLPAEKPVAKKVDVRLLAASGISLAMFVLLLLAVLL